MTQYLVWAILLVGESMAMNKKVVWGIDIAGRTGNNGVAKGEFEGSTLEITIYTNNGFTVKKGRDYDYAEDIFTKILSSNSILVIDTALDLQKLGNWKELFEKIKENWEEVKRSIDYAYKGLTPLADLFGAGLVVGGLNFALYGHPGKRDTSHQDK